MAALFHSSEQIVCRQQLPQPEVHTCQSMSTSVKRNQFTVDFPGRFYNTQSCVSHVTEFKLSFKQAQQSTHFCCGPCLNRACNNMGHTTLNPSKSWTARHVALAAHVARHVATKVCRHIVARRVCSTCCRACCKACCKALRKACCKACCNVARFSLSHQHAAKTQQSRSLAKTVKTE